MQIADLRIENFRGIRTGHILFGPHTVSIGQNNCGKTTVIEALAVLFGPDRMVRDLAEHELFSFQMIASTRRDQRTPNPSGRCRVEENRKCFFETSAISDVALPEYENAKAFCTQRSDLVDVARLIAGELFRPVDGVRFR